jgi:hypothetical protein
MTSLVFTHKKRKQAKICEITTNENVKKIQFYLPTVFYFHSYVTRSDKNKHFLSTLFTFYSLKVQRPPLNPFFAHVCKYFVLVMTSCVAHGEKF